jgi:reactive intermediate/imine deaminase
MRSLLVLMIGLPLTGAAAQDRQVIQMPGASVGLPFSSAVRVGNMLYLSGQLGNLPGTRQLVDTGIVKQTQQTFENMKAVLTYAGSSLERVVDCTVYLANIADYAKMNEVYATYFTKDPPTRATVAGSGLALGARVEIKCIAMVGP